MTTPWLEQYKHKYYDLLAAEAISEKRSAKRGLVPGLLERATGFEIMFAHLESLNQQQYHIVETGTLRNPGNWKDGQSAWLFTEFVDHYSGSVRSVDIDPTAVAAAKQYLTSDNFAVTCSDSIAYLKSLKDLDQVDLFYLDSWDVKWHDDRGSAAHHLKEFQAIESYIKPGAMVAIDDNSKFLETGTRTGKGRAIVEYLESKGIYPVYDAYQIIYKF